MTCIPFVVAIHYSGETTYFARNLSASKDDQIKNLIQDFLYDGL